MGLVQIGIEVYWIADNGEFALTSDVYHTLVLRTLGTYG